MGPRILDSGLELLQFRAVGSGLSKGKNIVVSLKLKKGSLEKVNSLDVLECSSSFSNLGKDTNQQPSMMAKGTIENTGKDPKQILMRINGSKADLVIAKLGFEKSFRVEATRFAGVIWLLWNDDISIDILKVKSQFIHMRIRVAGNITPFLCTAIYASPQHNTRKKLWNNLDVIAADVVEPWLLAGDFNVVLSCEERRGGLRLEIWVVTNLSLLFFNRQSRIWGFRGRYILRAGAIFLNG
ncbi:hypothetical protein Gohar_010314 [Gossypium harknessii]|uniref:Endonuclease/exonuclease/phosphatase domain-containing protein n=1 Tax=Gossypium harknessii TaxID=34285 RepID=A0A7J9GSS0_9ROSI|nr:hypothetical protein [Gossypium harknessii]